MSADIQRLKEINATLLSALKQIVQAEISDPDGVLDVARAAIAKAEAR